MARVDLEAAGEFEVADPLAIEGPLLSDGFVALGRWMLESMLQTSLSTLAKKTARNVKYMPVQT